MTLGGIWTDHRQNAGRSRGLTIAVRTRASRRGRKLGSELIRDTDLEMMLHHGQFIRDGQRAAPGSTTGTNPGVRKAEGREGTERRIAEIGEAILHARHPI